MERNALLQDVRADDFVEYFIYPLTENSGDKVSELHAKIIAFVSPWVEPYFWHKEKFNLRKVTDPESGKGWHPSVLNPRCVESKEFPKKWLALVFRK